MTALIKVLYLAATLLSGWLVTRAMSYLITISEKRSRRLLLFFGCYLLCATIIFIGDPFNILAATPVFLVIVLLSCTGTFWKKVTIGLMFSSTVFSFNALRDNYVHELLPQALLHSEQSYRLSCLFILPFALTLCLYTRKFAPDKDYTLSDSMWRLLCLLTVIPLGIVLDVVTLFHLSDHYFDILSHREYAILLLISLLSFISLLWCVTVLARQQKLEQQSMFAEINRAYYEAMEQHHFEIRRLKHDLANHIQILSALPEDKREAYASELSGSTALSQSFTYCGDSTINAVLTVKKGVMERCHIRLKTDMDVPAQLPYDRTDVCALYANALDNAMEACMKLAETRREISLKSKAGKGIFCLEVKNPAPTAENGQKISVSRSHPKHGLILPTSKSDAANHGFGLHSIREIVTRYHGSMEIKTDDGVFDLFLYLPLGNSPDQNLR